MDRSDGMVRQILRLPSDAGAKFFRQRVSVSAVRKVHTDYESNNRRRLVKGILYGVAFATCCIHLARRIIGWMKRKT